MKNLLEDERFKTLRDHPSEAREENGEQGSIIIKHLPKDRFSVVIDEAHSVTCNPQDRTYAAVFQDSKKTSPSRKYRAVVYSSGKEPKLEKEGDWNFPIKTHAKYVRNIWYDREKARKVFSSLANRKDATVIIVGDGDTAAETDIMLGIGSDYIGEAPQLRPPGSRFPRFSNPNTKKHFNTAISQMKHRWIAGRAINSEIMSDGKLCVVFKGDADKEESICGDAVVGCTGLTNTAIFEDAHVKGFIRKFDALTAIVIPEHEKTIFGTDIRNTTIPSHGLGYPYSWYEASCWAENLERDLSKYLAPVSTHSNQERMISVA